VSLEKALEFSEELGRLQNISKKLTAGGDTLFNIKKRLDTVVVKDAVEADITIGTVHWSKGSEHDYVTIDDDILPRVKDGELQEALDKFWDTDSLKCLLYVAITRARVIVILPDYLNKYFN
jgi:superfamily I DNA/RNA helicase